MSEFKPNLGKNEELALAFTQMAVQSGLEWQSTDPFDRAGEIRTLYDQVLAQLKEERAAKTKASMKAITRSVRDSDFWS